MKLKLKLPWVDFNLKLDLAINLANFRVFFLNTYTGWDICLRIEEGNLWSSNLQKKKESCLTCVGVCELLSWQWYTNDCWLRLICQVINSSPSWSHGQPWGQPGSTLVTLERDLWLSCKPFTWLNNILSCITQIISWANARVGRYVHIYNGI